MKMGKINLKECTNNKINYLEAVQVKVTGMSLVMHPMSWAEAVNECSYDNCEETTVLKNNKGPKI